MASASARIASFAARFNNTTLSDSQRHQAYRALIDTFAVAIAGQNEDAPRLARDYLRSLAAPGKATDWITGEGLPPESATWLNGIAAHVLDYDDVMTPMRGHVSVAMVPALVALAQMTGANGARYCSAYAAGFEVLAKLARAMGINHYSKGWHSTCSLGVLGATVACGVLLGLNEQQISNALGLAVSQAAGSRQNFGTMAKSFQAGHCGGAAVRAALLAKSGFTSAGEAMDGSFGYMTLYGDKENLNPVLDALGSTPLELESVGIDIKKYPCCFATHKSLDGLLALRAQHGLTLEQVDRVDVLASARGFEALICPSPKTGLEGKFSLEYCLAAGLKDGGVYLASFNDEKVLRPDVQAFFSKVTKRESDGAVFPRWVNVTIRLRNGTAVEKKVSIGKGDAGDPLSDDELTAKVEDCFSFAKCKVPARTFVQNVYNSADKPLGEVLAAFHSANQ